MNGALLLVEDAGPLSSLQDAGRPGYQRIGLSRSGPLDVRALYAANALVGNPLTAPAIELLLFGGAFRAVGGPVRLAVAGADCVLEVEGRHVPHHVSFSLAPGERLLIKPMCAGVVAMLAVAGGFDVPAVLGSVSLHVLAEVGGIGGRGVSRGDLIKVRSPSWECPDAAVDPIELGKDDPLRVVIGPQSDHFGRAALRTFLSSEFTVSPECNRMGYKLTGPRIKARTGHNIISDGIVPGAIQIPGSGHPIVLMADHQTTGGYPKIGTVITADLGLLAQRRAGETIRFRAVPVGEAQAALRAFLAQLETVANRLRPRPHPGQWFDAPWSVNLAGAAVDARDPESWGVAV